MHPFKASCLLYLPRGVTFNKGQLTYKHNNKTISHKHYCCGEAVSVAYSGCVSAALAIQHAMRMRHIVLSSVASLATPYLSTLSH
jgi:hypothetical protein